MSLGWVGYRGSQVGLVEQVEIGQNCPKVIPCPQYGLQFGLYQYGMLVCHVMVDESLQNVKVFWTICIQTNQQRNRHALKQKHCLGEIEEEKCRRWWPQALVGPTDKIRPLQKLG